MGDDIVEWAGLLHTSIRTVLLVEPSLLRGYVGSSGSR